MRDFLTGFAIILIVVLTAALVAPYFVDWNGQRAFVETRLSHALGQKVTVGGGIDLKLLPAPYLVLDQTVIGGDDGPIRIGIRHLRLELSVAPLLHGEYEVVDARLGEPTIRLNLERDRTLPAIPNAPAFQADVHFDHIAVADGTLAIADPESGRTFVFDDLDFDADAASLAGPFKGSGAEGHAGVRTKFRFATSEASGGKAHARLIIEEGASHAGIDLDGTLALTSAGRQTVRQSFDGRVTISGHLDPGTSGPFAWTLSGPVRADPQKASLTDGELRIGGEEAGLALATNAQADLGSAPGIHLDLTAKQLDIDRLSGTTIDGTTPPPPRLPDLSTLRRVIGAATPPMPTSLDVSIDDATWGGETLSDLAAHVDWGMGSDASHAPRLQIGGNGPGGSHLGIDGILSEDPKLSFAGTAELSASDAPRALDWLASIDPPFAVTRGDLPVKSVKLAGKVKADRDSIDLTGLSLGLDRSRLTGSLHLTPSADTPNVVANLRATALDIDALPNLDALRRSAAPFDYDLTLSADAIKVSQVGTSGLGAGHIDLALHKTGRHITLATFDATDLGGARIHATGGLDPDKAALTLFLDAGRLEAAANLVHQLAPGEAADALAHRAASLAPAKLTLDAAWAAKADGAFRPTRIRVDGTLDKTKIDGRVDADPARADAVSVGLELEAPEGSALLRQLGVPALPLDTIGVSRISLGARGLPDQRLDTTLRATFGSTEVGATGDFALLAPPHDGSGSFNMTAADLSPLVQSLALAFPDMTDRLPASVKGQIAIGRDDWTFDGLAGQVAGIGVGGSLRWTPAGPDHPRLTGALAIDRLPLTDLFGLAFGPPQVPAAGASWSRASFASGLVDPPRTNVTLTIGMMPILPNIVADHAIIVLGIAPNVVTMNHATATLAGGSIDGDLTLRRDGSRGALDGKLALHGVKIHEPALETTLDATLDLAGSGPSALGLVSSLAGAGEATANAIRIPGTDPKALIDTFASLEADDLTVDTDTIVKALRDKAKAPLDGGTRRFTLGLASGVLRASETDTPPPAPLVSVGLEASLDLTHETIGETVRQSLLALPKNWTGAPPSIIYLFAGPPDAPNRTVDVSGLVDAVATRAVARETARIEAYEADVRERAFFNQRLDSERRREQDRLKAEAAKQEAARRKAEAAAKAAEDAKKTQVDQSEAKPAQPRLPGSAAPNDEPRFEMPPSGTPADPSAAGRY